MKKILMMLALSTGTATHLTGCDDGKADTGYTFVEGYGLSLRTTGTDDPAGWKAQIKKGVTPTVACDSAEGTLTVAGISETESNGGNYACFWDAGSAVVPEGYGFEIEVTLESGAVSDTTTYTCDDWFDTGVTDPNVGHWVHCTATLNSASKTAISCRTRIVDEDGNLGAYLEDGEGRCDGGAVN